MVPTKVAVTLPGVRQRDADRQRLLALRDLEARIASSPVGDEEAEGIAMEAVVRRHAGCCCVWLLILAY